MPRPRLRPVLVIVAVGFAAVLSAGVALAQPAPPDPAETAYREGRRHYDLREWDAAIAKFKEAYRLRSDAASLFDIAQAYRLKGDCVEAQGFYKTYRRNFPGAPNIAKVDKFIADLEACVKAASSRPTGTDPRTSPGTGSSGTDPRTSPGTGSPETDPRTSPGTGSPGTDPRTGSPGTDPRTGSSGTDPRTSPGTGSPGTDPRTSPGIGSPGTDPAGSSFDPRSPPPGDALGPIQTPRNAIVDDPNAGSTQRIAGLAIAGVGVAAIGTGLVFALQASSKSNAVQSGGGTWDPSVEQAGKSAETAAESLWAIGGAAIVVGGALYYFGRHDAPRVAVQPRAGGASMVWSCDF